MEYKLSRYAVWAQRHGTHAVYAGLSGAMTTMDDTEYRRLRLVLAGEAAPDTLGAQLGSLLERRVLVPNDHDELDELRQRYDDTRWRGGSLGYTVVTSLGCNFECPYCFEAKSPSLLKPDVADALVRILDDSLPTIERLSVTWMGGEPLKGKHQLLELSDRFLDVCDRHDKEYAASIITNGWYLDASTARELADRRVASAQVTLDGPPDIHDKARPHANGGPTFDRIVANLAESADIIPIHVRTNVDRHNAHRTEELLELLAEAGLAGRVRVGLGRITDAVSNDASPLATYEKSCMSSEEFSRYQLAFDAIAATYGFSTPPRPPKPLGTPCTAVRASEIVVGSDGEMWKCWDDIGDPTQAIGTVFDYHDTNDRLDRWLTYHPADDPQCSTCVAMPVCMGGCAHHDFHSDDREARCGTFRHNHRERIQAVLDDIVDHETTTPSLPTFESMGGSSALPWTPVTLRSREAAVSS